MPKNEAVINCISHKYLCIMFNFLDEQFPHSSKYEHCDNMHVPHVHTYMCTHRSHLNGLACLQHPPTLITCEWATYGYIA